MIDQILPCSGADVPARPVYALRPAELALFAGRLTPVQAAFLTGNGFTARAQELVLLPGEAGVTGAVLGLGHDRSHHAFGDLATRLPEGAWSLAPGDFDPALATLGFCLGAYRYTEFKARKRAPATLVPPSGQQAALNQAASIYMVRDLINMPANLLGPRQLADAAEALAAKYKATFTRIEGAALESAYPTVAAVGRGSDRPPVVASFTWAGSGAGPDAPLVSLCGKGVVFDTGGYDLKPAAGMLRMKKDMGGAATVLGLARNVMDCDLPVRLIVRIGCVENSISGHAMRPLDVIKTRRGLTVEIGNTDAEGRLVLCDLLAEASDENPAILFDAATLTGAARVALGPELPALFATDDAWATTILAAGEKAHDPLWRMPLWDGYDSWLDSPIADLNNVSSKPMAGAITAALYMRRFLAPGVPWVHVDIGAWNDNTRPARPEGGEAQTIRAMTDAIRTRLAPETVA